MSQPSDLPAWRQVPILSGRAARLLLAPERGAVTVSLDLGRTKTAVVIEGEDIVLPDGQRARKAGLAAAFSDPEDCIEIAEDGCRKVYLFSESERRYYKLFQPFEGRPPTIVINNATMHAIVGKDPWEDAEEKVATVPRRGGECLDTCCGLGYSAQLLAKRGFQRVTTCEADLNVLTIAAVNPWSEGLFRNPRIAVQHADVREFAARSDAGRFACVFHDPPTVLLAGELYSEELYREFARILAPEGVLYHYVGAPGARLGRDYARGVIRRLQAAGFRGVRRVTEGVLAVRRAPQ
jgi:hypothetical protein